MMLYFRLISSVCQACSGSMGAGFRTPRLMDLGQSLSNPSIHFYLVAPDGREKEVQAQLRRPAFANLNGLELRYLLFSELCEHCAGLCKFGGDHRALLKIAKGKPV